MMTNIRDFAAYPVKFDVADDGSFLATVSGFPGAVAKADDKKSAVRAAIDAIAVRGNLLLNEKKEVPAPLKPQKDEELVSLPLVMAIKIVLRNEMLRMGVTQYALSRKLGITKQFLSQTLDLTRKHSSLDGIDAICNAIGKPLKISMKS